MDIGEPLTDQSALLAHLATPGVLDAAAPDVALTVIATHGAHVFLTGDRAFKLKRAVRYAYMDFGVQKKRDRAALAEITVNRRTTKDLYLGLWAIYQDEDGFRFGPLRQDLSDDGAIEHLVVMRRFDETATLDALADRGALSGELAERLAATIAKFHTRTPSRPQAAAAMKLARVSGRTMQDLIIGADALGADTVTHLNHEMQAALIMAMSELDERGAEGYVRRLHGDLHLGNVALIDGAPVLFDALEFNDAMATVDMLHDIAFLVMDLWTRGLVVEAGQVWSRYLAERRDYSGLALAPLFLAMRAGVRAKTGLHRARLNQDAANLADADAALAEAQRYTAGALALLQRPVARLVAIGGLSGAGKTVLARALAPKLAVGGGAIHLRSDVLRKLQAGVSVEEILPKSAYAKAASENVYAGLMAQAEQCLMQGVPVIVDAVFADPAERAAVEQVAAALNLPFDGLWVECPTDERQARIAKRTGDASDATPEVAARQDGYALGTMGWARITGDDQALSVAAAKLNLPQ